MSYFTRLSWNSNSWGKPSGADNKCFGTGESRLYECIHGFGWEEWLFRFTKHDDGYCYGFLECFNDGRNISAVVKDLHLYTRRCEDKCKPGGGSATYYVGKFDEVERLGSEHQHIVDTLIDENQSQMRRDLENVGLSHSLEEFNRMKNSGKIFNVRFKDFSLHIPAGDLMNRPIVVPHPLYKFMLYELERESDFLTQAKTYNS
jgi:hypothetical protein